MPILLSLWKIKIPIQLGLLLLLIYGCSTRTTEAEKYVAENIKVDTITTTSKYKLKLTEEYCQRYYGFSDYKIHEPKMIVIHYTAIPTLKQTIELFKKDHLASNRNYINEFSSLNVGIHYVVDKDGSIYNLTPDSIITRHLIGFNHVSIGIENVAKNEDQLTPKQVEANALLVSYLSSKYGSINYLIGHSEYNDESLPHYVHFKSLDKNYMPYDKPDPGAGFMYTLRLKLLNDYGLEFQK